MAVDMINHPPHYTAGKYETIDIIEDTTWGYRLATAFKYLHRCEYKDNKKEDLRKSVWFILREIEKMDDDDAEYDTVCLRCKHFRSVLNRELICAECLYPDGIPLDTPDQSDPPTKTSIGYEDNPYMTDIDSKVPVSPPKPLDPPGKVIPHNLPEDGLEARTERLDKIVRGITNFDDYRAWVKSLRDTRVNHIINHPKNDEQMTLWELQQYD